MLRLLSTILGAAALFSGVHAQTTYGIGVPNNVTSLAGTWSTGAGHVVTGLNFYDPVNNSFIYPATAGQSYSFTDDGYWEQALYLYNTNPAKPNCVSAQLIWQHGTYILNSNNTLTLNIFKGDGRQQVSDRCAERSNYVQSYDQVENMQGFEIHLDTHYNTPVYSLKLYEFDGNPKPIFYQVYKPAQMLPTQPLHEEIIGELNSS
ncbi:related to ROT1 - molecular chaperone in the endoplasmic reticulum [Ustilago trichophora]|uniref:Protein ROT1 n=1 Tax=Ustilago trichophora TaxID=86804 RepID=A0A5C3EEA7_9BASI|nr:related to ROT1 - molecular chaperone in the endoplasmic reticulum [Ustilago trichophora]